MELTRDRTTANGDGFHPNQFLRQRRERDYFLFFGFFRRELSLATARPSIRCLVTGSPRLQFDNMDCDFAGSCHRRRAHGPCALMKALLEGNGGDGSIQRLDEAHGGGALDILISVWKNLEEPCLNLGVRV